MKPRLRAALSASWPLLQGAIAATVAWRIATLLAVHPEPFFAPVAALVGLNAPFGERGTNTLRLLLGVFVGISTAEVTLLLFGPGYGRLLLTVFVAMAVARSLGAARIVLAQAAVSAILALTTSDGEYGLHRLGDAAVGAGVALVFSQVLFSPEPIRLLRRAERTALSAIAEGFARTRSALDSADPVLMQRALDFMRDVRDRLADLERMARQSPRVARHSAVWWVRRGALSLERERASRVAVLGTSCLVLTRTALDTTPPDRARLANTVGALGEVFATLAKDPVDLATRQAAVDKAGVITRELATEETPRGSSLAAAIVSARVVAADLLLFAGGAREPDAELTNEGGS